MKSLIDLSPIFNFLKKKDEEPKEPTFTLSEVTAIFEEAIMRANDEVGNINWDDIEYNMDIDWTNTVYISNVDASYQVEEVIDSINNCFESLLTDYVELRKENNI
jgi:hypothetical protein